MKKEKNYLDYIPVINEEYEWFLDEEDIVEIHVVNKGVFNRVCQILFKKPRISKIRLDQYGSTVWMAIDNSSDIGEIAQAVRDKFEDNDDMFYERLVKFFAILKENKFVTYKDPS